MDSSCWETHVQAHHPTPYIPLGVLLIYHPTPTYRGLEARFSPFPYSPNLPQTFGMNGLQISLIRLGDHFRLHIVWLCVYNMTIQECSVYSLFCCWLTFPLCLAKGKPTFDLALQLTKYSYCQFASPRGVLKIKNKSLLSKMAATLALINMGLMDGLPGVFQPHQFSC